MSFSKPEQRFCNFGYGMFIHYGLYTLHARGEWVMSRERMSNDDYFKVKKEFRNDSEIARRWVETAAKNGMKYAVLTTRHHDGFYLGDELVGGFCDACREFGLGVGVYYSVGDWSDPDFRAGSAGDNWGRFVEKTHRQLKDLMTRFGRIDYLFYDGCPKPETWKAVELHAILRSLQPELLISSRCGLNEDVASSEQHAGSHSGVWESCYTLNDSWGYHQYDRNWKTPEQVIHLLMTLRHNGGNLLLNVGPHPDGNIGREELEILEKVSGWLNRNGEAVYDVEPHPFHYKDQEISVGRGQTVYFLLTADYRGPERLICGIGNRIRRMTLLSTGESIDFQQKKDTVRLSGLSLKKAEELPRVLKVELEGFPIGIHNPMWPENEFRIC